MSTTRERVFSCHLLTFYLLNLKVPFDFPDSVDLPLDKDATERFLGFTWNWIRDTLHLKISRDIPANVRTKRELLKAAASINDPLSLLAVVKQQHKLLFQGTCRQKIDWDAPLDERIVSSWQRWASQLPQLTNLEIPRCIEPFDFAYDHIELHVFADSSEYAFGAAAYVRYVSAEAAVFRLVMVRSILATIRPTTMPRLELNAALSAARLCATVIDEMKMDSHRVVFWSDATTVLTWIR